MPAFAKTVTNPVEALVHVGKENTELHEELAAVYHDLDLYRDALAAIVGIKAFDPGDAYDRAKLYAEAALAGHRLPGMRTVRANEVRQ